MSLKKKSEATDGANRTSAMFQRDYQDGTHHVLRERDWFASGVGLGNDTLSNWPDLPPFEADRHLDGGWTDVMQPSPAIAQIKPNEILTTEREVASFIPLESSTTSSRGIVSISGLEKSPAPDQEDVGSRFNSETLSPWKENGFTCAELPTTDPLAREPCGIVPTATTDVVTGTTTTKNDLVCPFQTCTYQKPFSRQYDLDRHVKAKHVTNTKPFICPARGCFKKQDRTRFLRADKLTAHIRSTHNVDTIVECPHEACSGSAMSLQLLGLHLLKAHGRDFVKDNSVHKRLPHVQAILNAVPKWKCPVWTCKNPGVSECLLDHVLQHDIADLEAADEGLHRSALTLTKAPRTLVDQPHMLHAMGKESSVPTTRVAIRCPICATSYDSSNAFKTHLLEAHTMNPDQKAHFDTWKGYIEEFEMYDLGEIDRPWWNLRPMAKIPLIQCPSCSWPKNTRVDFSSVDHHRSMCSLEELKPYRRQILSLCPEIGPVDFYHNPFWAPMWDDLAKPQGLPGNIATSASTTN